MKLFGIKLGKGSSGRPSIKEDDKEWVNEKFRWLVRVFSLPETDQISLSEAHFPRVFQDKEMKVESLLSDCANHLGLDPALFSYDIFHDIRDTSGIPYTFADKLRDCFLYFDETKGKYVLVLANNIFRHPKWLITSTCYQISKVKLIQKGVSHDTASGIPLFLYLAATYFGYGVIIAQNLIHSGRFADSMWERKWNYKADIPAPVLAYALAAFAKIRGDVKPDWEELLPADIKAEFAACLELLNETDEDIFRLAEEAEFRDFEKLYSEGQALYTSGALEQAISSLQASVTFDAPNSRKTWAHNNIGYAKQMLGNYSGSIPDFENALKFNPNNGYANDNLGLAWIMAGDPDKGLEYLEKATQTGENHPSYSLRNKALYFQMKGENAKAEEYFQRAFEANKPVDLLDYFYGRFLLSLGDREKGIEHIRKSAEMRERQGIDELKRIL